MLGPNDPLNPDIPDPDADLPNLRVDAPDEEDFVEGDDPEAVAREPGGEDQE
jgi:hypothetical protein